MNFIYISLRYIFFSSLFWFVLVCSCFLTLFSFHATNTFSTHIHVNTRSNQPTTTQSRTAKKRRDPRGDLAEKFVFVHLFYLFFLIAFCFCFFFNFFYVSLFSVVLLFNFYSVLSILTNLNFILYSTVHHADHVVAECRRHRLLHTRGS